MVTNPEDRFSHNGPNLSSAAARVETLRVVIQGTLLFEPQQEKTCLQGFANNTGPDQPGHPRRLISAFVICFLEKIFCKPTKGEISIF